MYRRRRGLSQAALAGLVGRSESWLSQVERGIRSVDRLSVLLDMAKILHVDVESLIGRPWQLAPNGGAVAQGLDASQRSIPRDCSRRAGHSRRRGAGPESFRGMLGRGLRLAATVTTDGAPGLIAAVGECFPASARIRCWFHRLANIRAKLPAEAAARSWPTFTPPRHRYLRYRMGWRGSGGQLLRPSIPSRCDLRAGSRCPAGHPPCAGPAPDPGPHSEPVRTFLRRLV